ncbi:hypothetical protein N752_29170 [Desulforamulus aquiferis]|nr:phage portal protein [Desulforamulus aquiferis]RYD01651.1 hypothetical protein N752_29170 [Desulforamulus aquiferis]
MINPGLSHYEVILDNRYFLRELVESITLSDTLDEIAYRAEIKLVVTSDFPVIAPGQELRVSGIPFGGADMVYLLHPGVVWECQSNNRGQKRLTATVYDKTIYISKSEDEYLFTPGHTATQRLKQYAADWDIPLAQLEDTGIPLAKSVYRAQSVYSMLQDDLKMTVEQEGDMYRPRMVPGSGLELFKLGSNETVWVLETTQNLEEVNQKRTLEGTVTQVKVIGNAAEDQRSPVLSLVVGDVAKYGTLQKVHRDSSITDPGAAAKAGNHLLTGIQETFSVTSLDINTIRAGDKVRLNGIDLIVCSVRHELGNPGHMSLELGSSEYVRRRYYVKSL